MVLTCMLAMPGPMVLAQTPTYTWQDFVEDVADDEYAEQEGWTDVMEELAVLAAHPMDINTATREQMQKLPFLTDEQIEDIQEYVFVPAERARTLFATHYHELNEMQQTYPRIKNFNVSVKEIDGRVIFLRRLERGGSEHSFGIHVAKLAGMPSSIVSRADQVLKQLEATKNNEVGGSIQITKKQDSVQLSFFQLDDPVLAQVRDEILNLDVNNLTPLEALNKLNDIKRIVKG